MLNTSLSPWPLYTSEEINAVSAVLASGRVNYWTGDETRSFEREFAQWATTPRAIALTNGTVALDVAFRALGIGAGDEVIVTPRTFIASVSSVVTAGAIPVFADVDRDSGNISAATIASVLTPRTRAIVPVHLGGWPCDMGPIMDLARANGLAVIEDCAQAHNAAWQGRKVGSIGDVGAWSFCQDKIITTGGEGGMVTTANEDLWSRMWSFKDHGKSWDAVYERAHPPGYRWVHDSFGTNWRMMEMQAVIGRIQLARLDRWTASRTAAAMAFRDVALRYPGALRAPLPPTGDTHAFYRFYVYVRPDGLRADWSRDRIIAAMGERNIPLFQGSGSEVYRERAFDGCDWAPARPLSMARELGATSLAFLTHPTLTRDDMDRVCEAFDAVMREAAA